MAKPKQDDRCKACIQAYVDIENLQQQLQALSDGVNRRCGEDANQLPLVSLDRLLAAHERDIAECRRLLREVLRGRRRFMRDTLAKELYEAVEKAGGVE